ncbi:hydratase [Shewanella sp. AS16]|uniref:hydratase n=1 Tax=Shewanella sp. AS16 TaxID=2907625 RepID=UPI001F2011B7|nr:hydratase [Shewanella sp. AS16]MCE9687651.1 hydratase [Shewanella sp. AS16]
MSQAIHTAEVAEAARILAARRNSGSTGPLLPPHLRPKDFDSGFAIQQAVADIYAREHSDAIAGWKCLLPSTDDAMQLKTVVAPIYAGSCHSGESCPLWPSAEGLARVEPELAFILGHELPPRPEPYTEAEIDAAIAETRLALELIQSRYQNPVQAGFFDALADGLVNQGLWLGPRLNDAAGLILGRFELGVACVDAAKGDAAGIRTQAARHPNGDPRAGLYWLVNFLSARGIGLQAGQRVITGSYAGVLALPLDTRLRLSYGELGSFELSFTTRTR